MKKLYTLIAILLLSVPAHAQQKAEEILNTIVKVKSTIPNEARTARILGTTREGNGILIDSEGHILTIGYLVLEATAIEVVNQKGETFRATFTGYDHETGFGIIRINEDLGIQPIKIGQSPMLKEGDPVLVAGHGGADAVQGVRVVSRGEFAGYWEYLLENAIYTTPPYASYGGAALIGPEGELLGIGSIFTQKTIPGLGAIPCNMFVPIDLLRPILDDLISTGRSQKPPKPWLGLSVEEIHGRVIVLQVTSGGPAERAGLKTGDIVLTVNKRPVRGLADFYRKVWSLGKAGVRVPLGVLKDIQIQDVVVDSEDRYQYLEIRTNR
ncbi:MAG: serine protease [Desulfobacterales bacterium]|nr:MAG: serine protease [Desulfobacterales bacterium]